MFLFLISIAACGPSGTLITGTENDPTAETDTEGQDTDSTEDTDSTTTATDTATSDTDSDSDSTLVEYDCATIPAQTLGAVQMPSARGYHDVEFHEDGTIFGASDWGGGAILKSDYAGNVSVFNPSTATIQQIVKMPDGDYAIANDSLGIQRLNAATGGVSPIYPNIYAYGLIWGPDDMLWAADQQRVWRVDPATGDATEVVPSNALLDGAPRVIAFNLDYTKLYMGTYLGSQGRIYAVDLDANYDPVGGPYVFATGVGGGEYHDTMGVDICGNLYVADFWTASLHRIDRNGDRNLLVQWNFDWKGRYGHGMEWGTGEDGWSDHAIYMSQPYFDNNVVEIDIGVPSRDWPDGYAINLP
jgi:streptogramin lyase